VILIVTEVFRIDVVAILAMLSLTWVGSITPQQARSGFSSNAVLAIIAVMIMGRGLYKSGITEKIANFILQVAGTGRRQIISTVSVTVGLMSGLMQNLGAAALFLPVMTGISKREKISISSLLMPMGFAALLGGTLTMVGTSSLIVLNDLLTARGIQSFGLFSVLPIGLVLLAVGVVRPLSPALQTRRKHEHKSRSKVTQRLGAFRYHLHLSNSCRELSDWEVRRGIADGRPVQCQSA
jgi:di/tricarboxylate transporter